MGGKVYGKILQYTSIYLNIPEIYCRKMAIKFTNIWKRVSYK